MRSSSNRKRWKGVNLLPFSMTWNIRIQRQIKLQSVYNAVACGYLFIEFLKKTTKKTTKKKKKTGGFNPRIQNVAPYITMICIPQPNDSRRTTHADPKRLRSTISSRTYHKLLCGYRLCCTWSPLFCTYLYTSATSITIISHLKQCKRWWSRFYTYARISKTFHMLISPSSRWIFSHIPMLNMHYFVVAAFRGSP